jgi:hypothetical protein
LLVACDVGRAAVAEVDYGVELGPPSRACVEVGGDQQGTSTTHGSPGTLASLRCVVTRVAPSAAASAT